MKHITRRKLSQWTKVVGDRHDPTQQVTCCFTEVGNRHTRTIKFVQDFGARVYLNGREVAHGDDAAPRKFKQLTGLTLDQFQRAYDRVHPYFDDPMGSLGMYE